MGFRGDGVRGRRGVLIPLTGGGVGGVVREGSCAKHQTVDASAEVDRNDAPGLGQGEERICHQVLRVACREVARKRSEQVELFALQDTSAPGRPIMFPGHQRRALPA